jgi:predicted molibdopterin-dependent oxidoreductase YjgC
VKGWHAHEVVDNPNRLTHPLVRREGNLVEASWEEAAEVVANGLNKVLESDGPQAIGVLGSARCTNEDNYVLVRFARGTLQTPNIDCSARVQCVPGPAPTNGGSSLGAGGGEIAALDTADLILLVGSDPTEEQPAVAARIYRARQRGARVVAAAARAHPLARLADVHLPVRPGSELRWLGSLIHLLLAEQGLAADADMPGLAELRASVAGLTPEETEAATNVPAEALREVAHLYLSSKQVVILHSTGLALSTEARPALRALGSLAALSSCGGGPEVSVLGLLSRNNLQGCRDMGVAPDSLPGYALLNDDAAVERFEQAWKCELARGKGLRSWEMLGRVRAMYVVGDDVTRSLPDADAARRALEALDFLVVQDIFMSPAASMADVVLPAAAFAEREGTWTNLERRVQGIRGAVAPPGEAREDWRIVADVSRAMGKPLPYDSAKQIFEEITDLASIYAGIPYPPAAVNGGIHWSTHEGRKAGETVARPGGVEVTPLSAEALGGPGARAKTSEEYPLLLAADPTLRPWDGEVTVCHTLTSAGEFTVVARDYPDGMLCLNPEDAKRFGVRGGRPARVVSPKGEGQMQVRVTEDVPEGIALVPYNQATHSGLMEISTDPETGRPVLAPTPILVGPVQ